MESLGEELEERGLIRFFDGGGRKLCYIPTWLRHQSINNKERESGLPFPPTPPLEGKGKERKGKETASKTRLSRDFHASFEIFYDAYNVKKSKGDAEKAWEKLKPDEELQAKIMVAIEEQARARAALIAAGEWVPERKMPATWLNKKCWEDVINIPVVEEEEDEIGRHLREIAGRE